MKRHGNLFEKIIHPDNIFLAYKRARKNKGWRKEVKEFEESLSKNLLHIQKLLCTKEFTTSKYRKKIIYEPKQREIFILPFFPDRIIQHALLQVLIPIWDRLLIYNTFACREGKGMHEASKICMNYVRKFKYCLKCDIRKFYPSINHSILKMIIRKKIKCIDTLWLVDDIIDSFEGDKNTPIGNYTSQWFGNLYMNEIDQYIKHNSNNKAYIRYCDDMVIFGNNKQELHQLRKAIGVILRDNLNLQYSRWSVFPVTQGVDFLGYRHFKEKVLLRKSTAKRVIKRMNRLPLLLSSGKITKDQYRGSIASTTGWMKWANTHNLSISIKLSKLQEAL